MTLQLYSCRWIGLLTKSSPPAQSPGREFCGTDSSKKSAETTHRSINPGTQCMPVSARIALRSSEADACELEPCRKSRASSASIIAEWRPSPERPNRASSTASSASAVLGYVIRPSRALDGAVLDDLTSLRVHQAHSREGSGSSCCIAKWLET